MGNEGSQPIKYGEALENDVKVTWKNISTEKCPSGRDGHCACSVGTKCFVFGGVVLTDDGTAQESNSMLVFDLDTCAWEEVTCSGDIPPPRSAASMAVVGKTLYLFGGLSHNAGWFDDVHSFNTESNTWTKLSCTGTSPSPRDKLASATIGDKIYIFGGFGPQGGEEEEEEVEEFDEEDGEEIEEGVPQDQQGVDFGWFNDLFVFNTADMSWSNPMQMNLGVPSARAAHGMCAVDKFLVIFGGRDAQARRNDLHIFDTERRKWTEGLSSIVGGRQPEPRSFHTLTAVGGSRLVVLGGRSVADKHFDDVNIFDIETRQWLQPAVDGSTFPGRGVHTATVVGDSLLVFGGSANFDKETQQCQKYYNDVFAIKTADVMSGQAVQTNEASNQENVPTNIPGADIPVTDKLGDNVMTENVNVG